MKKNIIAAFTLVLLIFSCKAPGNKDRKSPNDSLKTDSTAVIIDSVTSKINNSAQEVDQLIKDL